MHRATRSRTAVAAVAIGILGLAGCGDPPRPAAVTTAFPMPPGPHITAPPAPDVLIDLPLLLSANIDRNADNMALRLLEIVSPITPLEIVLGDIDGGIVFTDAVLAARRNPLLEGATYTVVGVDAAEPAECGKRYAQLPRGNCYIVGFVVRRPDNKLGVTLYASLVRLADDFWRITADSYCDLIKPLSVPCPVPPVE